MIVNHRNYIVYFADIRQFKSETLPKVGFSVNYPLEHFHYSDTGLLSFSLAADICQNYCDPFSSPF